MIVEGTGWLQPDAVDAMVADVHEAVPGMADAPLAVVADPATGVAIMVLGDRRSSSLVVASPGSSTCSGLRPAPPPSSSGGR